MACAPGWRRSRWWWTVSAHAAANRGSLCGSGSAVSGGPPPGAEGTMTLHQFCKRHRDRCCCTSFHRPRPRSPAGATATCTSPGRQTLQENEARGTEAPVRRMNLVRKEVMSQKQPGLFRTWAAGVFSFRFVLTATTRLVAQILEIHLHLLTGLLDRCLCCDRQG